MSSSSSLVTNELLAFVSFLFLLINTSTRTQPTTHFTYTTRQWQTQTLRITSGNVSIGELMVATTAIFLPAVLKLANEGVSSSIDGSDVDHITGNDISFSRFNSLIMVIGYVCYLLFQLGSHREEFDYDGDEIGKYGGGHNIMRTSEYKRYVKKKHPARRNRFCKKYCILMKYCPDTEQSGIADDDNSGYCDVNKCDEISVEWGAKSLQNENESSGAIRRNLPQSLLLDDDATNVSDEISNVKKEKSHNKISCKSSDVGEESEDGSLHDHDKELTIMSIRVSLKLLFMYVCIQDIISILNLFSHGRNNSVELFG